LNASLFFKAWKFWASWLIIRRNTRGNLRSPPLLDYDAPATIPIKLDVSGAVNLHLNEAVPVLREEAQNLASSHQFAVGQKDDRYT
jgi:hypothetical protein